MRCSPVRVLAVVTAVTLATGCGSTGHTGHTEHTVHTGHATHSPAPSVAASGFSATDTAWLQLMIPMAERVLPVLDLAARDASTPAVRKLAKSLAAEHRDELDRLKDLRASAGVPDVNVHEGHDMPGMPTAAHLEALRTARGEEFDRLFAECVRAHLDHSLKVTRGELTAGADPRALAAAEALADTRIGQLKSLETSRLRGRSPGPGGRGRPGRP